MKSTDSVVAEGKLERSRTSSRDIHVKSNSTCHCSWLRLLLGIFKVVVTIDRAFFCFQSRWHHVRIKCNINYYKLKQYYNSESYDDEGMREEE